MTNSYHCGHCGYEGPCYGIPSSVGVSPPHCKRCEMNNRLTLLSDKQPGNPLLAHEQSLIRNGFLSLYGGFAQQNPGALISFNRLLNAHHFDTIIELGSHTCGFSLFFALYCRMSQTPAVATDPKEPSLFVNQTHHKSPKCFYTFDNVNRDQSAHRVLLDLKAHSLIQDTLFDEANIGGIRKLIKSGGSVLLLCDGGNKKREFELYGSALKPGDFVCLHDWAYDEAAFERNKREGIWHSWETKWMDSPGEGQQFGLKTLCERYGIEPVYADEFDKVAWFVARKT